MSSIVETHSKLSLRIKEEFEKTRAYSLEICAPLEIEDMVVQTDYVVSPIKWHLGHSSWLFEHFILKEHLPGYKCFHPYFHQIFNSYYTSQGSLLNKNSRGVLSRPTVSHVMAYRQYVDLNMGSLFSKLESEHDGDSGSEEACRLIELGVHHEKQHQELMLYDIKHIFWSNPLKPIYKNRRREPVHSASARKIEWVEFDGGLEEFGHKGNGFSYDNELPAHRAFLEPFALSDRLITNEEFLEFVLAGGYQNPKYWLANGWDKIQTEGWVAPLYWQKEGSDWLEFTLFGLEPLQPDQPVCHLSLYEADAFTRWAGFRLPTEYELEILGRTCITCDKNKEAHFHPRSISQVNDQGNRFQLGEVWEWTQSAYLPYPGYSFINNGLGEYNGKFMNNQIVLRGGSCATPPNHLRYTYRNFFESGSRWQCSGIRVAKSR